MGYTPGAPWTDPALNERGPNRHFQTPPKEGPSSTAGMNKDPMNGLPPLPSYLIDPNTHQPYPGAESRWIATHQHMKDAPGKPDVNGNVWKYQTVTRPNPKGVPYKDVKVVQLVNQNKVPYQEWFQRKFGIDAGGKMVNPLGKTGQDIGSKAVTPPEVPRGTVADGKGGYTKTPPKTPPAATTTTSTRTTTQTPPGGSQQQQINLAASSPATQALLKKLGGEFALPGSVNAKAPNINPASYGKALTAMQYGPVIADLMHEMQQGAHDAPLAQAAIGKFFAPAEATSRAATASDDAQATRSQGSLGDAATAMMQALGLGAGGDQSNQGLQTGQSIANQSLIAQQGLAGEHDAQHGADMAAQLSTQQGETNAHMAQQAASTNAMQDLASKLLAQRSAMGDAQVANRATGEQLQSQLMSSFLQNQGLLQNQRITGEEAKYDIIGKVLQNQGLRQGLGLNALGAGIKVQQAADSHQLTQAQLAQLRGDVTGQQFIKLSPTVKAQLGQAMLSKYMRTPNGSSRLNPNAAYTAGMNALGQFGYSGQAPAQQAWLRALINGNILPGYKGYTYDAGKNNYHM